MLLLILGLDLVFLDGAVGLVDAHDQGQAERGGGDADDDGGEDQHVGQRIGIDVEARMQDGRGSAADLAHGDVEQEDRGSGRCSARSAS